MLIALLLLEDILQTASELYFVVQVMTFAYMLFWLYMTFRDAQILFGIGTIAVGYVIFIHGLSIMLLAAFFMLFIIMGSQIQMLMWFGIMPLFGYQQAGDRFVNVKDAEEQQQQGEAMKQQVMQRIMEGNASAEEKQYFVNEHTSSNVAGGTDAMRGSGARGR